MCLVQRICKQVLHSSKLSKCCCSHSNFGENVYSATQLTLCSIIFGFTRCFTLLYSFSLEYPRVTKKYTKIPDSSLKFDDFWSNFEKFYVLNQSNSEIHKQILTTDALNFTYSANLKQEFKFLNFYSSFYSNTLTLASFR